MSNWISDYYTLKVHRTQPFIKSILPTLKTLSMRYRPDQYDQTACDGLNKTATHGGCPLTCEGIGLAGNVCPVVLACSDLNGCSTTSLVGFGFNPTIVRAPEHLRRHNIEFIGTDRFEQNNKSVRPRGGGVGEKGWVGGGGGGGSCCLRHGLRCPHRMVKCRNPNLRRYIRNNSSTARLLLLNKGLQVLHRAEIYGGRCMRPRYSVFDCHPPRLHIPADTPKQTYRHDVV